jgi:hypothetical protein
MMTTTIIINHYHRFFSWDKLTIYCLNPIHFETDNLSILGPAIYKRAGQNRSLTQNENARMPYLIKLQIRVDKKIFLF